MLSNSVTNELNKCFMCNCEYFPFCHIEGCGQFCDECFNVNDYTHSTNNTLVSILDRNCVNDSNDVTDNVIYNDVLDLSKLKFKSRKGGFTSVRTKPNGDCLYESISTAFNKKISIQELRNLVSNLQTIDTFTVYKLLSEDENDIKEYEIIKYIDTLDEFKHVIRRCGYEYGAKNCLWGDENALHHISNTLNVHFVVCDGRGNFLQKISPRSFCDQYIVLKLNNLKEGFEHFTLIRWNGESILTEKKLTYAINTELSLLNTKETTDTRQNKHDNKNIANKDKHNLLKKDLSKQFFDKSKKDKITNECNNGGDNGDRGDRILRNSDNDMTLRSRKIKRV